MKNQKKIFLVLLLICAVAVGIFLYTEGWFDANPEPTTTPVPNPITSGIKVHYIDVGQGDSIFIELPDSRCMLIDAGEKEYGPTVVGYINKLGYSSIDILVITHPHTDHMGGMQHVIESLVIKKVYMPNATNSTKAFENMVKAIQEEGCPVVEAKAGVNILNEANLVIDILAPNSTGYESLNDYSAVVKLTYGQHRFLFTGDAETTSEKEITADVSCDFVKVGHHGSTTSSGSSFVKATGAKYAIFQVGTGNDYGHPKEKIVERWKNAGATILRTDLDGNIVISTDGTNFHISSSKGDVTVDNTQDVGQTTNKWILNTGSKKIHCSDCSSVEKIDPSNYAESTDSIAELINQGYTPCGNCKPTD